MKTIYYSSGSYLFFLEFFYDIRYKYMQPSKDYKEFG